MKRASLVALVVLWSSAAWPATFHNQFVEFTLPAGWTCQLEDAEWVCQGTDPLNRREAIIVLAAKLKGDQDTLATYADYLKGPRRYSDPKGQEIVSRVKFVRERQVNGYTWIDALHEDSEIPGFLTRYFATVRDDIGVLVTYSVRRDRYMARTPEFEAMVSSLKVFRSHRPVATTSRASGQDAGSAHPRTKTNASIKGKLDGGSRQR